MVKNDKSEFVKVDGAYRVSDIMVGGQPLDVNKTYTLASHNYMLKDAGDGYTMFGTKNVKLLKDGVMIDNQVLINYIVNNLGGVVGEQYAAPQGRITIKTAASDVPTNESDKVIAGRDTTVTEGDTYTVVAATACGTSPTSSTAPARSTPSWLRPTSSPIRTSSTSARS